MNTEQLLPSERHGHSGHPMRPVQEVEWNVLAPDGLYIQPDNFPSKVQAEAGLRQWIRRYEMQGYYRDNRQRIIELEDLPKHCKVVSI